MRGKYPAIKRKFYFVTYIRYGTCMPHLASLGLCLACLPRQGINDPNQNQAAHLASLQAVRITNHTKPALRHLTQRRIHLIKDVIIPYTNMKTLSVTTTESTYSRQLF